jgi:hypothetical protein
LDVEFWVLLTFTAGTVMSGAAAGSSAGGVPVAPGWTLTVTFWPAIVRVCAARFANHGSATTQAVLFPVPDAGD